MMFSVQYQIRFPLGMSSPKFRVATRSGAQGHVGEKKVRGVREMEMGSGGKLVGLVVKKLLEFYYLFYRNYAWKVCE